MPPFEYNLAPEILALLYFSGPEETDLSESDLGVESYPQDPPSMHAVSASKSTS